ncbi:hypothetical protein [Microcoleus sp. MON2_D5]|uniref:hypothetical protein n=1 Tax=Microcoleus sp. MON2_D5 TaxID=2818833 RepID=UPI002FD09E33
MSLLKVSALSLSGLTLWLAPPFVFSRKIPLHNFMQGIALVSGFACCFEGRRCALKVAKAEEFEAMKARAIQADVEDEVAVEVYVSEQQRRKEAEAILAASDEEVEAKRKALEAIYHADLPDAEAASPEFAIYQEVQKALDVGKSPTWVIENVLNMKGRKFGQGKVWLQDLLDEFGSKKEEGESDG